MNLPNFFLVDLPPEAEIRPAMITEACTALRRNRERYLASRETRALIRLLSQLATNWLEPDYPFRRLLVEHGPEATGFPRPVLVDGINGFFRQLTAENLMALVLQETGHLQRLDQFSATELELKSDRAALVHGPELLVHVTAGTLPNPALTSIVLGLLARSAQFIKCASRAAFVPRLFCHSIYDLDPKLGSCLEVAVWPGGSHALEDALFTSSDCITVTGSDATIAAIRARLPEPVRFLGYGHRVSFGYVAQDALGGFTTQKLVAAAARDVVAWNQQGCLSPHVIYVETGGAVTPESFAERLASELESRELTFPRGVLTAEESAAIATRRSFYQVRAAHSPETRIWRSEGSTAWTVVYESSPQFTMSCLNRFIYVKGVSGPEQVFEGAAGIRSQLSTVGLAAPALRTEQLAKAFGRWGAKRICPLGRMQEPPLTWRHDGRPALADLLTWTDHEQA